LAKNGDGVLVCLARMDDDGQIPFARQPDLGAKDLLLHVTRREVVVIVEADLSDSTGWGGPGKLGPTGVRRMPGIIRELVSGMRMDPDREADLGPQRFHAHRLLGFLRIARPWNHK